MSLRRILLISGLLLILFLGMYSWNYATHTLDDLATDTGLEAAGFVLTPANTLKNYIQNMKG